MKLSSPVSAAVLGLLATFAPTSSLAALTNGVGTFTSSSNGRWLYYDLNTNQIFFGSTSTSSPPATVFNITADTIKDNYKVQVTDNQLYLSSGNGSSVAKAT
ncbi:hypothetical protein CF319_g4950, partial [Tilletia indica]